MIRFLLVALLHLPPLMSIHFRSHPVLEQRIHCLSRRFSVPSLEISKASILRYMGSESDGGDKRFERPAYHRVARPHPGFAKTPPGYPPRSCASTWWYLSSLVRKCEHMIWGGESSYTSPSTPVSQYNVSRFRHPNLSTSSKLLCMMLRRAHIRSGLSSGK